MVHRVINSVDYLEIPGYPNYYLSDYGEVYTMYRHRNLKQSNNTGYKMVFLKQSKDSKGHWEYVHRLLAIVFLPPPLPDQIWINHKDGIKDHNRIDNLEWSTISENIQHSYNTLNRKAPAGKDHYNYGRHLLPQTKQRMSEKKIGEKHPRFEGYYITPFGSFSSAAAAGKATGIPSRTIDRRCKSNKKTIEGYSFQIFIMNNID